MLHKTSHRNEKPPYHHEEWTPLTKTRANPRAAMKTQHSQKKRGKKERQKHTFSPSVKEAYLLILELQPGLGSDFRLAHPEATELLPGNMHQGPPSLHSPLPCYSALVSPRKELIITLEPWCLWLSHRRHLRSPGLVASRAYTCSPTGLYIFAYSKSCCPRVWLPIHPNLRADQETPLQDTDSSWHILNTGSYSK